MKKQEAAADKAEFFIGNNQPDDADDDKDFEPVVKRAKISSRAPKPTSPLVVDPKTTTPTIYNCPHEWCTYFIGELVYETTTAC